MLRRYFDPLTALLAAALLVTAYRLGWIAVNSWHGLRNDDFTAVWWIALSAGLAVLRWAVRAGEIRWTR